MSGIRTNRDLYLAVAELGNRPGPVRPLEEYLRALWGAAVPHHAKASLTPDEFFDLLAAGYTAEAQPVDPAWRERYEDDLDPPPGFDGWEARVLRQIVDLREMAEHGQLADEQRFFGIDSPRGSRWYNFDPGTFLECAVCGTYGGWEPGDDTGRDFVPGPVAAPGPDGQIVDANPQDITRPVYDLQEVTWDDFRDFLGQGQWYE